MNELQETIIKAAIPPGAIKDNAAFSSLVIDRNDFPGCAYLEFVGVLGATDVAMAVLKVVESDTKTNSTTLGGTPADVLDIVSKPGTGADDLPFVVGVDLRKTRQRYLQLQATAGNGTAGEAVKLGLKPSDYVLFPMTTEERAANADREKAMAARRRREAELDARHAREKELAAMEKAEKKAAKAGM